MKRRLRVLLSTAAVLTTILVGGRFAGHRFLFPTQDLQRLPHPIDFVEHQLLAHDGVVVRAIELGDDRAGRTIVHFHTNRETAESIAGLARALRGGGLAVILVEYRGYGYSVGTPTEAGVYADAEAVFEMLARRGVGPDRITLSGASLGTGVAAEMARRGRGSRLLLVAPYTSIPGVIEDVVPLVPSRLFIEDRFDTLAKAAGIAVPTLVVHGDADEIVPFWMGERLTREIKGAVLRRVAGGHHGDLFERDPDLVAAIVAHAS